VAGFDAGTSSPQTYFYEYPLFRLGRVSSGLRLAAALSGINGVQSGPTITILDNYAANSQLATNNGETGGARNRVAAYRSPRPPGQWFNLCI